MARRARSTASSSRSLFDSSAELEARRRYHRRSRAETAARAGAPGAPAWPAFFEPPWLRRDSGREHPINKYGDKIKIKILCALLY